MSKSIDYGRPYKSWSRTGSGLNVICRFRFDAPAIFRAHRSRGAARGSRAARRDRHKAYAARCPLHLPRNVIRRDAGRGDKGRGAESFVSSRSDRKSGAERLIFLIYVRAKARGPAGCLAALAEREEG